MRWILILVLGFQVTASWAQSVALSGRVGLSGPGIEITTQASSRLQVRLSATYLSINTDRRVSRGSTPYQITGVLTAGSASILLDLFVHDRLRISAGLATFVLSGSVRVLPLEDAEIAGATLSPEELGSVSLTSAFPERPAPYLGVGYGNPIGGSRVSFLADLGLTYAGRPSFDADSNGRLGATANWAPVLEHAFRGLRWYPVLSVGIGIRIDAPSHS